MVKRSRKHGSVSLADLKKKGAIKPLWRGAGGSQYHNCRFDPNKHPVEPVKLYGPALPPQGATKWPQVRKKKYPTINGISLKSSHGVFRTVARKLGLTKQRKRPSIKPITGPGTCFRFEDLHPSIRQRLEISPKAHGFLEKLRSGHALSLSAQKYLANKIKKLQASKK